ncbi:MAG: adenosylcobinamide-GDP ribazoletransferase [Prevotella sp.]|nr:adenosylcobinamide-GDP ribazoletransferase [Prevotella sp.]
MQKLPSISDIGNNAWAALMFFTRLPLWRVYQPPRESYKAVVEFWPLAGWLTGGIMALTLYVSHLFLPYTIAVLLAIIARLLTTGALHEDGLADFCDGFGGGTDRQRILDIMKDSHIGTYGVVGLIAYFALLFMSLVGLSPTKAVFLILAADPFAKMLSSQIVQMMPYARTEEQAKARVVYRQISTLSAILLTVQGVLPALLFVLAVGVPHNWQWVVFVPCIVMYMLYRLMWHKLRGYTGDCCGAMFLLVELSVYLAINIA